MSEVVIPDSALPPEGGKEYADKMIARGAGETPPVVPPQDEKAQLLAGKFKTQDDLVKAYAELEKKLGAPKPPEPVKAPEPAKVIDPSKPALEIKPGEEPVKAAEQVVEKAGLDWAVLTQEFSEKGALEATSYETLEKAGIPKAMVDQFIEGQVAVAERARNEVFSAVGGQEKYVEMVGWAAKSLSAEEQTSYNAMVNGPDRAAAKLAVSGLQARFAASGATDPALIGGGAPSGSTGFASSAEMKRAMSDPKYSSDPAFRADVMNKLKVSKF